MANTVKIKRSAVPGKVPAVGDLSLGELAINTYDGKLYTKKDVSGAESVVLLGGGELLASNNLSDVANAGTARTNLGLAIGTNVQAYDAGLQSIAGLTTAADRMIYTTASDTYAVTTLTAFGRSIIDDADATAGRSTLGLGTAATRNTGTSGSVIPTLDAAGTWSSTQTFNGEAYFALPFQSYNGAWRANLGSPTIWDAAIYSAQFSNKISHYPEANVIFEITEDGTNWTTFTVTSEQKKRFVAGADAKNRADITIPRTAVQFRVRIVNDGNYVYLNTAYFYASTQGNTFAAEVWKKSFTTGLWEQHTSNTTQRSSWPGHFSLNFSAIPFRTGQHYTEVYILLTPVWAHASNTIQLYSLEMHGGYPAGRRTIYTVDENKLVEFPAGVTSTAFTENGVLLSSKYAALSHTHTMSQITDMSAFGRTLVDDADASAARTTLGLANLATTTASAFALTILDDVDAAAVRTTIGAAVWNHAHAASDITSGVMATARLGTGTANSTTYLRGDGTWAAVTGGGDMLKSENLSGLANYTTARSNLGLGTSATVNTGTSGATIPLLNAANTFSAAQIIETTSTLPQLIVKSDKGAGIRLQNTDADTGTVGEIQTWSALGSESSQSLAGRLTWTVENVSQGHVGWALAGKHWDTENNILASTAAGALTYRSNTIWHAGNDGAGSGLDADTVDGLQASAFAQLSGAAFTGAVNMPSAPGTNPGLLNVVEPTLGGTATNTKTIATFRTSSSNEDKIIFDAIRHTTGTDWNTASLRVRRMVDASNHNFLEFANNGTYIGWGTDRRIAVYNGTNSAMDILGRLNLTTALGTNRTSIDWGQTQSGLTIWNIDNTPLFLGTSGVNRMAITAAGEIDFGTDAVQTNSRLRMRKNGNNFEWGHTNTAGYGSTLGAEVGTGAPFIAFSAEAGTTGNTYRTRGLRGGVFRSDNAGGFIFGTADTADADNQTLAYHFTVNRLGNAHLGGSSPVSFGATWRCLTIGGGSNNGVIRLQSSSATVVGDMFTDTTAFYIRTATAHSLVLRTNDTDRVTIDNGGQVTLTNFNPTSEFAAGFRGAPVNRQDSSYTLVLADSGKTILKGTNTASQTYTIPANGSVAYPVGTILTFANLGNVAMSIAITTDPMYLSPGGSTGTRTLAGFGMATAVKVTSTNWMISGVGLT